MRVRCSAIALDPSARFLFNFPGFRLICTEVDAVKVFTVSVSEAGIYCYGGSMLAMTTAAMITDSAA